MQHSEPILLLNDIPYPYSLIKSGGFETKHLSAFEKATLEFSHQWLNGQQEFIIHTSGSTGKPKPIAVSRTQMQASARMTLHALDLKKGDKALVCLNTAYIAGKMMLVRGFEGHLQLVVVEPSGNPFQAIDPSLSFDFTALVPLQLEQILASNSKTALEKLKAIIIGGAPMSYTLEQHCQQLKVPVYATYGMTETVSHIALKRINGPEPQAEFHAFEDVQLETDERGCLTIQSILTKHQKIVTNDLVQLKGAHTFEWIGRADFVINSGGVKIQSEQVEKAVAKVLFDMEINSRFFITGLADEKLGQKVSLVLETTDYESFPETTFMACLKEYLGKYELPKVIHQVKSFKETQTGKLDRKATLETYHIH